MPKKEEDALNSLDAQMVYPGNRLYLDYISGQGMAASFFSHLPSGFAAALTARREVDYPREEVCSLLETYNARLQADPVALENIAALRQQSVFCVTGGQQAGFLGGPVYTLYKIITTIRLAELLERELHVKVVPLFWLASEDHDFTEINRAYLLKQDGEVGAVSFTWEEQGRPISDLPLTEEVLRGYQTYLDTLPAIANCSSVKKLFAPQLGENYCAWHARIWLRLFSNRGLVIVDPSVLCSPASTFFRTVLEEQEAIQQHLREAATSLSDAGYEPALSPDKAGRLFTLDAEGRRVRVKSPFDHLTEVIEHPERYSTDAALRPLLSDTLLPSVASVLGPGETAYHAMLKPLYQLFRLPQPVLFPRKSYTVLAQEEADLIMRYGTSVAAILSGTFNAKQVLRELAPKELKSRFSAARETTAQAFAPLRALLGEIDPGLEKRREKARTSSLHNIDQLENRAIRAGLAKRGLGAQKLQQLCNALLPRGRPQERVFPLPYFINRYGSEFVDRVFSMGQVDDFSHHVITLEGENG
ncbi:MAG: bacillithiol biosynthesis cysteine-adding enzyme BshC [Candidatus Bipolaricaulota bacterium]